MLYKSGPNRNMGPVFQQPVTEEETQERETMCFLPVIREMQIQVIMANHFILRKLAKIVQV